MISARGTGALLALLGVALSALASEHNHPVAPNPTGEAIYLRGELGSGAALEGARAGGLTVQGQKAACVNCHRRSGLGSTEGAVTIPPITGDYLYHQRSGPESNEHPLMYVENVHGNREPYSDETLARAIREGLNSEGHPLSVVMPRFDLGAADMSALLSYLKELDRHRVPGVSDTILHFATIVTPDADPVRQRGVVDVLNQYFADKNLFPFAPSPRMRTSASTLYSKSMYAANRRWQLHVWELSGPAATWRAQLEQDFVREPVMAVISGLAGSEWAPVHDFCEQRRVPCLFPNVEAPPTASGDFYTVYLSRGVLLEASLIGGELAAVNGSPRIRTVRQIYRHGDNGEVAAQALADALRAQGVTVLDLKLPAAGKAGQTVAQALHSGTADAWVLWLRPDDLATLGAPPPEPARLFVSGLLGGLEQAPLPGSWRERARLTYPVDLPDKRVVRVDYPLGWFRLRHVEIVDARVQADTYLACGILAETLKHMADTISPEYLVEQLQETLEHRILTGYYPRLSLAPGQTVGSKGAYWVRFADATGSRVVADSGWIVP